MGTNVQTREVTTWRLDPTHTLAEFGVKHLMVTTVKGRFTDVQGAIQLNEEDPMRSSVEVRIAAGSIDTREERRDAHLRSADFLDAESYPEITFRSRKVDVLGEDHYRVTGALTIRGTTNEVVLDVHGEGRARDPWGGERMGFTARTRFDRRAFGLTWNQALETGGVLVGNEVKVEIDVQAVLQED